ncbi:MAG: FecCD family ABC transporter permease [Acidiferrobacterales bacterium]
MQKNPMQLKPRNLTLILLLLMPVSLVLALKYGATPIDWTSVWLALSRQTQGIPITIIWELRLPRVLTAFAVGGLLSLSGALLQVLLRNPLADPYVLGVSGGAATGALLSMFFGISGYALSGNAFLGALISMFLVFGLAHSHSAWTPVRLLLTGVVIAAGWGAAISFILAIAPNSNLQGMLFWLMGDLSNADTPSLPVYTVAIGLLLARTLAPSLNLLVRGELVASALGEHVKKLRIIIFLLASAMTAVAVTAAGTIGFVGLVIPHLLRMAGSNDHRDLITQSMLLGGIYLVIADTLSRTIMSPLQLPVGVLTAFIGVPLFLYLLWKNK